MHALTTYVLMSVPTGTDHVYTCICMSLYTE